MSEEKETKITTIGGMIINSTLREKLLLEVGGICPIPRCTREIWDLYPIDGNASRALYENLVPLCQAHFAMAKSKKLTQEMLRTIRNLLSNPSANKPALKVLVSSITTTLWYTEGVLTCCFCLPTGRFVDESG